MHKTLDILHLPNAKRSFKSFERQATIMSTLIGLIMLALMCALTALNFPASPANAQESSDDPVVAAEQVSLTVKVTPDDANIRIMNIKPAYEPGMKVNPGLYHVRVEKDGFESWDNWLKVEGTNFVYPIKLKPAAAAPTTATPTVVPTQPSQPSTTTLTPAAPTAQPSAKQANPNLVAPPALPPATTTTVPKKLIVTPPPTTPAPAAPAAPTVPKTQLPQAAPTTPKLPTPPEQPPKPQTKAPPMVVPKNIVPTVPKNTAEPQFTQPKFGMSHSMQGGGLVVTMPTEPSTPSQPQAAPTVPKTVTPAAKPVPAITPARPQSATRPVLKLPTSKPPTIVPPRASNAGFVGKTMRWTSDSVAMWTSTITDPNRFLHAAFKPTTAQIVSGATFHLGLFAIALLFFIPIFRPAEGGFGAFTKILIASVWTLAATALIALTIHVAFWILGGKSNVAGTYLAYVYSVAPYLPAFGIASLFLAFAFPWHLRHRAANPHSAEKVIKVALSDTVHRSAGLIIGAIALAILIPWSLYLIVNSLGFVHKFSLVQCLTAFAVSIPLLGIAYYVNKVVATALLGQHVDQYDFDNEVDYGTGDPAFADDGSDDPSADDYAYEPQPGLDPDFEHPEAKQPGAHANGASHWETPEQFRPTLQSPETPNDAIQPDSGTDPGLMPPTLPPLSSR